MNERQRLALAEKASRDEWGELRDRAYEFLIDLSEATIEPQIASDMAGSIAQRVQSALERK